ncbi:ABC transporter permease [Amycolatopsis rhizosphaerae]|uniref:ABC transporter permease n=1 Tax=Amycolatopsis rhizosphaerae TaxID=2053003 RepID=A0A558C9X7_9PSEU|nr:ABC transporter permease [Amycolatopsis rhizosphaerae]TVT45599.1 ABC transporter permease [Amycolatopsis rhizosphaerae]
MIRATARWLGSSAALLFVVTVLTFLLSTLAPGDAAKAILSGQTTSYTPEQYLQLRHALGIDQPLPVQYWHWLDGLLHGSLGTDLFSGQPIAEALNGRLAISLSIIVGTVVVSGIAGVGLGVYSAVRGGLSGRLVDGVSLLGLAAPNFWLALVLVEVFAVQFPIFPATGYVSFADDPGEWLRGLVLPVLTLSAGGTAFIARQTRDAMADVLTRGFVVALRAHGIPLRSIIFKHALRNAAIPVVTLLGLMFVSLLGGTVLVESVFAVPGLGQQAVTASSTHNLPMVEGVAFYFTLVVVVVNLLVDISYRLLNPKVRAA